MKLNIITPFKFAHGGIRVVEFEADSQVETDDHELVDVATAEGWAELVDEVRASAHEAAPENAALEGAARTKPKRT